MQKESKLTSQGDRPKESNLEKKGGLGNTYPYARKGNIGRDSEGERKKLTYKKERDA